MTYTVTRSVFAWLSLLAAFTTGGQAQSAGASDAARLAPTATRSFTIHLKAPVGVAAPLFGPVREREWSPQWNLTFVNPATPVQQPGLVFTTSGAPHPDAVWVMTEYDAARGRIAYVVLIPGFMVTEITIEVTPETASTASATVRYRRTPLVPAANDAIAQFADHFAAQGPHWEAEINRALAKGGRP